MKKITLILIATVFYACNEQAKKCNQGQYQEQIVLDKYDIIVLDSCEYIAYKWAGADNHVITHKGNCKYCIKRLK